MSFLGKTVFITGASRGIGKSIAIAFGKEKANVACFAKTFQKHEKLPGTVLETVNEVNNLGGKGLSCIGDVRNQEDIVKAIESTVTEFGGLDILVNNASALFLDNSSNIQAKKLDLMIQINVRGTFLCSQSALPHLAKSSNPHIITIAPPLNMNPKWFKNHLAYTISKYAMSMCVLGMSQEFKGIGINALWPKYCIYTSALISALGEKCMNFCRKPEIMADSALQIALKDSKSFNGNFLIDEDFLRSCGVTYFEKYACDPIQKKLLPDLFV